MLWTDQVNIGPPDYGTAFIELFNQGKKKFKCNVHSNLDTEQGPSLNSATRIAIRYIRRERLSQ